MQNFRIEIHEGIYDLFLHGNFIGHILYDDMDKAYVAYPRNATYSAVFFTLEEAVIELVFHMYRRDVDKICMC